MTPLPLRLAVRLLPADTRDDILAECLERYAALVARDGRAAANRWAWRQPWVALVARLQWGRPTQASAQRHPLSGLVADAIIALRSIRRRPGVALAVVTIVAIGVSALSVATSVIDAVLVRPLPYPEADRLVWLKTVTTSSTLSANPAGWANPFDVADWAARANTLAALAAFETFESTLLTADAPVRVNVAKLNATVGEVLGIHAAAGRLFTAADYAPNAHVLVLSNAFWRRSFGADPAIVGRSVVFAGTRFVVVGILPPLPLQFPQADTDVWLPLPPPAPGAGDGNRGGVWQHVVARIRQDRSIADAQVDLKRVAQSLAADYPRTDARRSVLVQPFRDGTVGATRPVLTVLGGAVVMVLLIACANVGHLLLVAAQARRREFSVRTALGAPGWRLARLMLVESTILSGAGGLVGIATAPPLLHMFLSSYPDPLPSVGPIAVGGAAVAMAIAATCFAAVVSAVPPLVVARATDVTGALRATDRGSDSPRQRHARSALVLAQIAMSTALLAGGGLLLRTFWDMRGTALGFDARNLLTFNVALPDSRYPTMDDEAGFYDRLAERLRAVPGVTAVGTSSLLPLSDGEYRDGFVREGSADQFPNLPIGRLQNITPGFLEALGLTLRAGRTVQPTDTSTSPPVAVVNQTMERLYFPKGAVGRRIRFRGRWVEIVGVVSDKRHLDLREEVQADLYLPRSQSDEPRLFGWVLMRTSGNPNGLVPAALAAVRAVGPEVSVAGIDSMTDRLRAVLAPDRFRAILIGSLAGVALLLAAVGLYGLIAYSVALGIRDIAIRMALGATTGDTVGGVLARVMLLACGGIAAGLALALGGTRLVAEFLSGVTEHDPLTLASVVVLLLVVALVAAAGPAVRASRVDPITALRVN
jgi:putative ABC transport system permease protein